MRILSLILLVVLTSCLSKKDQKILIDNHCKLNRLKSISIQTDSTIKPFTRALYYHENLFSKRIISFLKQDDNTIVLFDLDSSKIFKKITYDLVGPNGVGELRGFHIINKDSIFITPKAGNLLYLVNSKKEVIKKYNYQNTSNGDLTGATFYARNNINTPLIIRNNKLYLTNYLGGNYNKYNSALLDNYPAGISIDENGTHVTYTKLTYPKELWSKTRFDPAYSKIEVENRMIYLWRYYPYIFIETFDGKIDSVKIETNLFNTEILRPQFNDFQSNARFYIEAPSFYNIAYDKYRNYYYVFFNEGYRPNQKDDLIKLLKHPRKFSLIILNQEFEKLCELSIPKDSYLPSNFFITEEGLYLSKNNEFRKDFDENHLNFDVFRVSID